MDKSSKTPSVLVVPPDVPSVEKQNTIEKSLPGHDLHVQQEKEDAKEQDIAPCERIISIEDVDQELIDPDFCVSLKEFMWVGTRGQKITTMASLSRLPNLQSICLRSNLIPKLEGISTLSHLTTLELYDNKIKKIPVHEFSSLTSLKKLDLSFNLIKRLEGISHLVHLTHLYVANNRISKIECLENLRNLEVVDLGANRIREIPESEFKNLAKLRELWLGKNKLTKIKGFESLHNLIRLDLQANRLEEIQGLDTLESLEELYMSHQGISSMSGIEKLNKIQTLDISSNKIEHISHINELTLLEECMFLFFFNFEFIFQLEGLAKHAQKMHTLRLEHCPLSKDFEYRTRIAKMFPFLKQLDATFIR
eukprot:GSMAST32.ASY1.ANO1.2643.1 assembled CDS